MASDEYEIVDRPHRIQHTAEPQGYTQMQMNTTLPREPTPMPKLVECPACGGKERGIPAPSGGWITCTHCRGLRHTNESLRALIAWREEQGDAP